MNTPKSLNDFRNLLASLPAGDNQAAEMAISHEQNLTKPAGGLGRLEWLSQWLSTWQHSHPPRLERPRVIVFAGTHGITSENVSAYPAEVTEQMVANFISGGAAINQLCIVHDAELRILEVAIEIPTRNFAKDPAMEDADCAEAMAFGMSAVEPGLDLICLGEMGIGNTTSAAALCHAMFDGNADSWVGPGTGVHGSTLERKRRIVENAVKRHKPLINDGLDALQCLGGRELAAIAGAIIAARLGKIPVVLDGYVSCAAAAMLTTIQPGVLDHCVVGHMSSEPGHKKLLEQINKQALLDLDMRLGEGSGAALAIGILRSAVACHNGMATFAKADVATEKLP